ncbi:MAG: hypothetical protein ACTSRP_10570 [Candidatus Helarchaeota archaeon]
MSSTNEKKSNWKVILKSNAFKKIILHCTRFANYNIPRSEWKEVYGFLAGRFEGEDVVCNDAIPMTHGGAVDVEFTEKNYIEAANLNEKLAEKNEFIVGWYHSHPGLNIFLSTTDIRNHIGYQCMNPKAVALVFDHTQLRGGSLGFKIFNLDDPNTETTGYHEVDWVIPDIDEKIFAESLFELSHRIAAGRPGIEEYGEISNIEMEISQQQTSQEQKAQTIVQRPIELVEPKSQKEYQKAMKNLEKSFEMEKKQDYIEAIRFGMAAGREFEKNNMIGLASDAYLQVGRYLYELWEHIQKRRYQIFLHQKKVSDEDIQYFEKLARALYLVAKEKKAADVGLILEIKDQSGNMVKVQDEEIQIGNILMEAAQLCEIKLNEIIKGDNYKSQSELCLKAASFLSTAIIFARNVKKQKELANQIFNYEKLSFEINYFLIKNQEIHARLSESNKDFKTAAQIYKGASIIAKDAAESLKEEWIIRNFIGLANFYLGRMCTALGDHEKFIVGNLCNSAPYYKKAKEFFIKAKDAYPEFSINEINEAKLFLEEAESQFELAKKDCLDKGIEITKIPENLKVKTKILKDTPEPIFYP